MDKLKTAIELARDFMSEEIGRMSTDNDHDHAYEIDTNGDGQTTDTKPATHTAHTHEIKNGAVQEANGHTHTIEV